MDVASSEGVPGRFVRVEGFQRTMFGELSPKNETMKDLSAREVAVMLPLVALVFWIGLYPKPFLALLEPPAAEIVQRVQGVSP